MPNLDLVEGLLDSDVSFVGSLGNDVMNRDGFKSYATNILSSLSSYRCVIERIIDEENKAVVEVLFSGIHTGDFLGYSPTGQLVQWRGVAHFEESNGKLLHIEVKSDTAALKLLLDKQRRGL